MCKFEICSILNYRNTMTFNSYHKISEILTHQWRCHVHIITYIAYPFVKRKVTSLSINIKRLRPIRAQLENLYLGIPHLKDFMATTILMDQ